MQYLKFSLAEAESYPIYSEEDFEDAVRAEAQTIADSAGSEFLDDPGEQARDELRWRIEEEAKAALNSGQPYKDPTGVTWTLESDGEDMDPDDGRRDPNTYWPFL